MKAEDAKVGMRVYETECGEEGTIIKICNGECLGCEVSFDKGMYTWMAYEDIEELKDE